MHPAKERYNLSESKSTIDYNENTRGEAENLDTGRDEFPNTYLDCCHHLLTEWILWFLIDDVSKQEERKTEDASAVLPRVDSGIGINLLGQDNLQLSCSATPTPPASVTLIFRFDDGTTIKHVPYPAFSNWSAINAVLHQLAHDGIVVHDLWDVQENMQIGSGDWHARIQPGSQIEARCFKNGLICGCTDEDESSGDEGDDEMVESDEDGGNTKSEYRMSWKRSAKITRKEHTWWFTRWRERVEKTMPGRKEALDEPSWFMIVLWCTSVVGIVIIVTVLSL